MLDNHSGLIWEVKTDDGGYHDKDNVYLWGEIYREPFWNGRGKRYEDWNELVDAANSERLCGFYDWRVPELYELASLVRCRGGRYQNLDNGCAGDYQHPTIDSDYFPNTRSGAYLSASPDADASYRALLIYFLSGYSYDTNRGDYDYVRLVRSSQ